jgi:hypothetical protein
LIKETVESDSYKKNPTGCTKQSYLILCFICNLKLLTVLPTSNVTTNQNQCHIFKNEVRRRFLQQNLEIRQRCRNSKLLSNCHRSISLDPILRLPMPKSERSRCIRWRLGWLPGGKPRPCPKHPTQQLSKNHAINCLDMHRRLFMPETIRDPLSFLLNMLSLRPSVPPNLALT